MFMPDGGGGVVPGLDLRPESSVKSILSEAEEVILGVNSAIVAVGKSDVQTIAEIADFDDRDTGKACRKALVDPGAQAVRAFAGQPQFFRRQRNPATIRRGHCQRRQI